MSTSHALISFMFLYLVGTSEQLSLAVQHDVDISAKSTEVLAKFACASYQNGTDVATWARAHEHDSAWMSPLFVSIEEDLLCFIVRSTGQSVLAPEILSKLSFLVSIPAQMKLEPNILEMIDTLSQDPAHDSSLLNTFFSSPKLSTNEVEEEELEIDLTISYYSDATTIYATPASNSPNSTVDNNDGRSATSVGNLLSYSTGSLSSFYWTESSASGESFNNSVSKNVDRWDDFSDALNVQSTSTTGDDDPCHFGNLGVFSVEGDIVVPLNSFMTSCNSKDVGACLAFLVSEYAADPLVSHMSLTSRPVLLNYRARSIQQVSTIHACR
jgi:hypothetical protein